MKAIGGYFELELSRNEEYHNKAIRLNTGRNAFEYILLVNSYTRVYLPFFTCDVLLEPLHKHKIAYEFYNIDENLEPVFDYSKVKSKEAFLYTNYFGLKNLFINEIASLCPNLIIDCAQSFFSKPLQDIDTFYSARKFFGVPDGAYLYSNKIFDEAFVKDESFDRFLHLLKRIDRNAEEGYRNFVVNDSLLDNQDIKEMSALSKALLSSIDYNNVSQKRIKNFNFLHENLNSTNKFKFDITNIGVPMIYPYWNDDKSLRQKLVNHKIYTPTYWNSVKQFCGPEFLEYHFVDEILYLPIDQRYDQADLGKILELVL